MDNLKIASELVKLAKSLTAVSKYGWIIDWVNPDILEAKEIGICGPSGLDPALHDQLKSGKGDKFEMLDDDKVLYYKGRLIGDYEGFEPLDDFGGPNAGCTIMKIKGRII